MPSVVSAAASGKAVAPAAGKQFLDFLQTPFAKQAIRDSGLDLPQLSLGDGCLSRVILPRRPETCLRIS